MKTEFEAGKHHDPSRNVLCCFRSCKEWSKYAMTPHLLTLTDDHAKKKMKTQFAPGKRHDPHRNLSFLWLSDSRNGGENLEACQDC